MVREMKTAKEKFGVKYGNAESNNMDMKSLQKAGGISQVRLLEHWENNQKHGLFEGFDRFGNKTFKDEFKHGITNKASDF